MKERYAAAINLGWYHRDKGRAKVFSTKSCVSFYHLARPSSQSRPSGIELESISSAALAGSLKVFSKNWWITLRGLS
jgi:hypothetical protein